MITYLKLWLLDIRWSAILSHAAGILIGFLGGVFWKNKALEKDRDEWKAMANSQLNISKAFKKKYVTSEAQVKLLIRENRNAHQRTQEFRRENNYLFAVLMREGMLKPEDHKRINAKRLEDITNLFNSMHK